MKTQIIIGAILLSSGTAKAYNYADVIRHNQDKANYNRAYAKAEMKMYQARYKRYEKLSRDLDKYASAHQAAMVADNALRDSERNLPEPVNYSPDWNYGATGISWRAR